MARRKFDRTYISELEAGPILTSSLARHKDTLSSDATVASDERAILLGPVTIASTLTVAEGGVLLVL